MDPEIPKPLKPNVSTETDSGTAQYKLHSYDHLLWEQFEYYSPISFHMNLLLHSAKMRFI
jgi:hypothetical protein